jgi:hypothetical protein
MFSVIVNNFLQTFSDFIENHCYNQSYVNMAMIWVKIASLKKN